MTAIHVDYILDLETLPRECIEDCSRGGCDAGPATQHWRQELGFTVDQAKAREHIAGYGAWDREEIAEKDDDNIAEIILWLACCNFSEFLVGGEDAGSDLFVLE